MITVAMFTLCVFVSFCFYAHVSPTKTFMQSLLFETTFTRKQKQKEEGQVAGLL